MNKHETLRIKISAYCTKHYATEETPIKCNKPNQRLLTIGHDKATGLSELQLPRITEIFHDNECIVWVRLEGSEEPIEVDGLTTSDLEKIINWLEEYC